ncbi:hypothetical protein CP556_02945 [Natrinema sp. CBA1119]|uniref:hypothetical protein n=1 Tax=Natrinema sp. CBA1119 TaxID=1608465 RepID=UPI000BF2E187|nr:hypothetical protein [Natrinema sp. CBA1119]PGF15181.1 hypothetical protein CP556_02945 [Natrinema sp. CBA1119]
MRLTPSWLRSSSGDSAEEQFEDSDALSGVTMVYAPESDFSGDGTIDTRIGDFIPESDAALVAVLDEMSTPVTVDEVTDTLVEPARPSIETWATIHERLHQNRLPALDAKGAIEFDETQGLIERSTDQSGVGRSLSRAKLAVISVGILLVLIVFVSAFVLIA